MVNSLLSIVLIAKRNTSLSFIRALRSIINQIYQPIQVLVVDVNEPNGIYSLGLQEDLAAFPEIEYLHLDQSLSSAEIRNHMIPYVGGEYIAFITSNDVWDSTKALLQIEQLKENVNTAASCSNGVLIDERKADVSVEPLIEKVSFQSSKWILDNPAKMSAQVIYRTQALKKAGGFDKRFENFCDGDMLLRLDKENKVLLLPVSLCHCYITPDQEEYDWINFKDNQKILLKYMELFLANKRLTQNYYLRMIQMARKNYLWLNYLGYVFMYFSKAPLRSTLLFLKRLGNQLNYISKWYRRELSLRKEELRIARDIRLFRNGKTGKVKALKPVVPAKELMDRQITFSSAREYNKLNNLEFVFDHKLGHISIPDYVTVIKKGMFYGCDRLESVVIPNTVAEIRPHAFHNCKNLRSISIQEGSRLGKIGAFAFAGCVALESVSLPSSIVSLGKYAFFECCSLKELLFTSLYLGKEKTGRIFPTAIVKIPRYTFAGCSKLQEVEFGENSMLEILEKGAFLGCDNLRRILLTGSVNTLESYSFAYCRKLETAVFPQIDALKEIGKGAFQCCEALAYFQIPNEMERIHVRTFYGCSALKLIKIPKKVLSVSHQAFAKCDALEKVMIFTGDAAISSKAFDRHTRVQIVGNAGEDASLNTR